jgi:hypothetical protein
MIEWRVCCRGDVEMRRKIERIPGAFVLFFLTFVLALFGFGEDRLEDIDELKKTAPRVFIDCQRCDIDYIRTEITFVNFVRDRKEADVHLLITTQRTGSGGQEYTISFIGQGEFKDLQSTLKYVNGITDTYDEVRKGLVQTLKLGLAPFVARTPLGRSLMIGLARPPRPTAVSDAWDFWVFNVSANTRLSGEKTRNFAALAVDLSASRVTPESKLQMALSGDFDQSNFDYEETQISSSSTSADAVGQYVYSVGDHWAVGGWVSLYSSTYRNLDYSVALQPALEYNFFPYSISTRRLLRILYRIGPIRNDYIEETVYGKVSENLLSQALSISLDYVETWGDAGVSASFSHYFHDFSMNRFSLYGDISVRVFKGLSLGVNGSYAAVHDQISLRREEASLDELLLRRKELASNYRYSFSVGLSYSFGSVFSNVVNPRFGTRMRGGR